jgi:hypothetical protein
MHFGTKSYLKSTRNHTAKHALTVRQGRSALLLKEGHQTPTPARIANPPAIQIVE